jgi:hypothetical protein
MACSLKKVKIEGVKLEISSTGSDVTGTQNYANPEEVCCIDGTLVVDMGEYPIDEVPCLQGKVYEKGGIKFGTGTLNGKFDGEGTDKAQLMLIDALYNEKDFYQDQPMHFKLTFDNSKGTNGTIIEFDALVSKGTINLEADKKLRLDFDFQQTVKPTITYAS